MSSPRKRGTLGDKLVRPDHGRRWRQPGNRIHDARVEFYRALEVEAPHALRHLFKSCGDYGEERVDSATLDAFWGTNDPRERLRVEPFSSAVRAWAEHFHLDVEWVRYDAMLSVLRPPLPQYWLDRGKTEDEARELYDARERLLLHVPTREFYPDGRSPFDSPEEFVLQLGEDLRHMLPPWCPSLEGCSDYEARVVKLFQDMLSEELDAIEHRLPGIGLETTQLHGTAKHARWLVRRVVLLESPAKIADQEAHGKGNGPSVTKRNVEMAVRELSQRVELPLPALQRPTKKRRPKSHTLTLDDVARKRRQSQSRRDHHPERNCEHG